MTTEREVYAFCVTCDDSTKHLIDSKDVGSCTCTHCGANQALMVPIPE